MFLGLLSLFPDAAADFYPICQRAKSGVYHIKLVVRPGVAIGGAQLFYIGYPAGIFHGRFFKIEPFPDLWKLQL